MRGRHPTDVEILDWVVDGCEAEGLIDHLVECERCHALESELRAGAELLRRADLPDHAPRSWQAFSSQLRARLDRERRPFWGWSWLPALGAAGLVLALSLGVNRKAAFEPKPSTPLPAWTALPPDDADPGLAVLAALVDGDEGSGCDLARCLVSMTDEEGKRVAEGLGRELGGNL